MRVYSLGLFSSICLHAWRRGVIFAGEPSQGELGRRAGVRQLIRMYKLLRELDARVRICMQLYKHGWMRGSQTQIDMAKSHMSLH